MARRIAMPHSCWALLLIVLILTSLLIFVGAGVAVSAEQRNTMLSPGRSFRCLRPFSQLASFKPGAMRSRDNCEIAPFMNILSATANVSRRVSSTSTAEDGSTAPGSGSGGLYVTVSFTAQRFDPDHAVRVGEKEELVDSMRYMLELRAVGSSTVKYKGFDNVGYSVCCTLLQHSEGAECQWVNMTTSGNGRLNFDGDYESSNEKAMQKEEENGGKAAAEDAAKRNTTSTTAPPTKTTQIQVVKECPLHDKNYEMQIVDGRKVFKVIHGSVTRPLHRIVFGDWEASISFFRGTVDEDIGEGTGLGKLVVPFRVNADSALTSEESPAQASLDGHGGNGNSNSGGVVPV